MLSSKTTGRLRNRFGPEVDGWLAELPALVDRLAAHWGLEVVAKMVGGTSCTFRCRLADGRGAYLKLTPDAEICATEAAALRAWEDCPAVVSLLDVVAGDNALLIEALEPGTPLTDWRPAAGLLAQLRAVRPPTDGFPSLAERVDYMFGLARRRGPNVSEELIAAGHDRARRLAAGGPVHLVHGDLHSANVLDGGPERGYVAIDPRPCLGDPDVDVVDWAVADVVEADEIRSRIADLGVLDEDRAFEWSRALAVLLLMSHVRRGIEDAGTALLRQLAESLV